MVAEKSTFEALEDCLPGDHSRQVDSRWYIPDLVSAAGASPVVLDLGCGDGRSVDLFRTAAPDVRWVGVDIEESPEVAGRTREDADFRTFDGIHIPEDDAHFDLVYCHQVFEHVRHPEPLLAEVRRVLKPGGIFFGSTSQLEPYHSFSFWNYTVPGFRELLVESGLTPLEFRPGIDGLTLILRRGLGRRPWFDRWYKRESPLNRVIGLWGRLRKKSPREVNGVKLLLCGHFCFMATRGESDGG
jgi:SAM-dependent methyltransferase